MTPTMRLYHAICAYCELAILPDQTAVASPDNEREVMHTHCRSELESFGVPQTTHAGRTEEEQLKKDYESSPARVAARIDSRKSRPT